MGLRDWIRKPKPPVDGTGPATSYGSRLGAYASNPPATGKAKRRPKSQDSGRGQ